MSMNAINNDAVKLGSMTQVSQAVKTASAESQVAEKTVREDSFVSKLFFHSEVQSHVRSPH